jgi:hypothetical protein
LTATEVLHYSAGLRGLDDGWQTRARDLLEMAVVAGGRVLIAGPVDEESGSRAATHAR